MEVEKEGIDIGELTIDKRVVVTQVVAWVKDFYVISASVGRWHKGEAALVVLHGLNGVLLAGQRDIGTVEGIVVDVEKRLAALIQFIEIFFRMEENFFSILFK